ncbi:MAG TPA: NADH-quinone oxidoreductase subunit C [Nitrososphaera sp.]|jgi:NADH-quinone oxidoreductase subunit C|nr:NADH-quinone oxidoreductase subunit C [Nitrososphaera sp.]
MSTDNKEELNKVGASSQSKDSPTATDSTTKQGQSQPPSSSSSSPQPKQSTTKPSQPPATTNPAAATTATSKVNAAAPPAKTQQPEPPAFEKGLVDQIKNKFGDNIKILFIKPLRIKIQVDPQDIVGVANFLRDNLGFDHAESVAGTDYPKDNQIEVIYHLGSYARQDLAGHILWLTTRTDRDDARLPTLINVFKSVEYHERECYEMLGVYFEGHPRNERFLLPEDWADIPPLRKDFKIKGR